MIRYRKNRLPSPTLIVQNDRVVSSDSPRHRVGSGRDWPYKSAIRKSASCPDAASSRAAGAYFN